MNKLKAAEILNKKVEKFKTIREASIWLGISDTHLNRLLTGEYDLSQDVCNKIGLERNTLTTYTKVTK